MSDYGAPNSSVEDLNLKLWLDISRKRHAAVVCALAKVLDARSHTFVISAASEDLFEHLRSELEPYGVTILNRARSRGAFTTFLSAPSQVARLAGWARQHTFDLTLCLDNPVQAAASRLIRVPVATLLENPLDPGSQILRRAAGFIGAPHYLTAREMTGLKIRSSQIVWRYEDAPEAVFFDGFKATPTSRRDMFEELDWPISEANIDAPLVIYRPADRPHSKREVVEALAEFAKYPCITLVLTTDTKFSDVHSEEDVPTLKVLPPAEDSRRILSLADLVVSHGITLVKEASVVKTPAFWISRTKPKNRLLHLIERGAIAQALTLAEALSKPPQKRQHPAPQVVSHLASDLVAQLESFHELSS